MMKYQTGRWMHDLPPATLSVSGRSFSLILATALNHNGFYGSEYGGYVLFDNDNKLESGQPSKFGLGAYNSGFQGNRVSHKEITENFTKISQWDELDRFGSTYFPGFEWPDKNQKDPFVTIVKRAEIYGFACEKSEVADVFFVEASKKALQPDCQITTADDLDNADDQDASLLILECLKSPDFVEVFDAWKQDIIQTKNGAASRTEIWAELESVPLGRKDGGYDFVPAFPCADIDNIDFEDITGDARFDECWRKMSMNDNSRYWMVDDILHYLNETVKEAAGNYGHCDVYGNKIQLNGLDGVSKNFSMFDYLSWSFFVRGLDAEQLTDLVDVTRELKDVADRSEDIIKGCLTSERAFAEERWEAEEDYQGITYNHPLEVAPFDGTDNSIRP